MHKKTLKKVLHGNAPTERSKSLIYRAQQAFADDSVGDVRIASTEGRSSRIKELLIVWVAWGGTASAPSAEPQHRTKALNQSTHTPQDEAELVPPECVERKITIVDARQYHTLIQSSLSP